MGSKIGIWIDHERAVVVTLDDGRATIVHLHSGVPGRVRLAGGSRSRDPYGPQDIADEKSAERKHSERLKRFYRRVLKKVGEAERLFVFGPGEARREFAAALSRSKQAASRLAEFERADKMTDAQIVARVKEFYGVRVRRFTVPIRALRRGPPVGA